MAIDFYTALRSRARSQERGARLSGRPLTSAEATAPYVALAETAGERLRAGKATELAERGQVAQEQQFGDTLEADRAWKAEQSRMEAERLAEAKRAEDQRIAFQNRQLAEQKRTTNLQLQAAEKAGEVTTGQRVGGGVIGAAGGAWAGAAIGAKLGLASGNPLGAIIGGVIGFIGGIFKGDCIIISACTNPYSYEVNLARAFRDRYMGPETLVGYYAIALIVASVIDKFRVARWFAYHGLVKHLVDYGEWVFEKKEKTTRPLSKIISKAFLKFCGSIGRRII